MLFKAIRFEGSICKMDLQSCSAASRSPMLSSTPTNVTRSARPAGRTGSSVRRRIDHATANAFRGTRAARFDRANLRGGWARTPARALISSFTQHRGRRGLPHVIDHPNTPGMGFVGFSGLAYPTGGRDLNQSAWRQAGGKFSHWLRMRTSAPRSRGHRADCREARRQE
jgi:hypothetical protein